LEAGKITDRGRNIDLPGPNLPPEKVREDLQMPDLLERKRCEPARGEEGLSQYKLICTSRDVAGGLTNLRQVKKIIKKRASFPGGCRNV